MKNKILISLVLIGWSVALYFAVVSFTKEKEKKQQQIEKQNKKQAQFRESVTNFCVNLVMAEEKYQYSRVGMAKIFQKAIESETSDYILKASLKQISLKLFSDPAQESLDYISLAEKDFLILGENNQITPEFKNDLVSIKDLMERNLLFIKNCDEGELSGSSLDNWLNECQNMQKLISSLNLEMSRLLNVAGKN